MSDEIEVGDEIDPESWSDEDFHFPDDDDDFRKEDHITEEG